MKLCDLTYAEALRRHPDEVENLLRRLRHGSSKHRGAKPEELSWQYDYYQSYTMLCAYVGRWWGRQRVPDPPECKDWLKRPRLAPSKKL